ncbi:glutathione S-transferase family protein [Rhizorhabdus histidinilytica]|uniref:GST-like protein n=1 Tax=Rhizorhabdus histidinilytica TaxID=439228 RepID=A0A1T5EN44_9SPHN|nr:glutathione S-transferase C-terminal domain-containing protein [Rhizorhabdus histidinilytica]SKB85080.1 GST-like protein [Rhizorhabdus histidinilytica]
MITLYAADSPNVVKIHLALEEMGLAYRTVPIDVMAGETFAPDFLRINPNGKVPVIVDETGSTGGPVTIFESGAILIYLAEKTGMFLPTDAVERYQTLQWLMVQMSGLGPILGQFVHFRLFAPVPDDYALSRYTTLTRRVLDALETRLGDAPWLGGSDYSIADMATFPWIRPLARLFGPEIDDDYPRLTQWVERIGARPATARALDAVEAVGRLTTPPGEASPENRDKVFGRGAYARTPA